MFNQVDQIGKELTDLHNDMQDVVEASSLEKSSIIAHYNQPSDNYLAALTEIKESFSE